MNSKTKIVIGILIVGIMLIGSWGIWRIWNSMAGRTLFYTYAPPFLFTRHSTNQQPYFDGERRFFIGKFEVLKDPKWHANTSIPKVGGEDIYNSHIANTTFAKISSGKGDTEFKDFANKDFFFFGYDKAYPWDYLIRENPNDKSLRQFKAARKENAIGVFEIEQMIPIEGLKNDNNILSFNVPDRILEEFEISVTVKNVLQTKLVDTICEISIKPEYLVPFGILETTSIERSDHDEYDTRGFAGLSSSGSYGDEYNPGEEKNYKFKIRYHRPTKIETTDIELSVFFAGYGIGERKEIKPVYSRKVQKYKLLWIKD